MSYKPIPLTDWVRERIENSARIASMKSGSEREGWLQDLGYWNQIEAALSLQKQMTVALWQAWFELNTIRARDGVPWQSDGWKASVTEEYFSKVVDDASAAIEAATGRRPTPWHPTFGTSKGLES